MDKQNFAERYGYYRLVSAITLSQLLTELKHANGCGTKLSWWIPDKILGVDFSMPCNIHDIECTLAKNKKDLHTASDNFLLNMRKVIKKDSSWVKSLACYIVAEGYVKAVNYFWLNKYATKREFE